MDNLISACYVIAIILILLVGCSEIRQPEKSCKLDDISENLVCLDERIFLESNGTLSKIKPAGFRLSSKCECK